MQRMDNKNIGAEIITFNPELRRLEENLDNVYRQVKCVTVVDNCSQNIKSIEKILSKFPNINLIKLESNKGIAFAQNIGMKYFYEMKYNWVITLDQDSVIPENTIEYFYDSKKMKKDTGIIALGFDSYSSKSYDKKNIVMKRSNEVIASGNLVNVFAWNKVGGFDNYLFIDYVDFDFDAKLINNGFTIWESCDFNMKHEIGNPINHKFLMKILHLGNLQDHNEMREYYIMRNQIIYAKRYPNISKKTVTMQIISTIFQLRHVFVLSKPKLKKLKSMIMGINDGIRYKNDRK